MWNKTIALPVEEKAVTDAEGFDKSSFAFLKHIPAETADVTRSDEILAAQKGYTVSINIGIMACNYAGQSWLIDEQTEQEYDIKRTYKSDGKIILSCERRELNGI